jgi:hypothetical protein
MTSENYTISSEEEISYESQEEETRAEFGYSFSEALKIIQEGGRVFRYGWNGKRQYIGIQYPRDSTEEQPEMTRPFIYIRTVDRDLVPWVASQTDLLSSDWITSIE